MSEETERHDRMAESRTQFRIEFQRALARRLEAKHWPPSWTAVLAGECLLALDESGFELLPPFDLDPVAIELGLTPPPATDSEGER